MPKGRDKKTMWEERCLKGSRGLLNVAMSENRFLRFLLFRLFRVSHSMKCQNMMGRPFVFERRA